MRKSMFKRILSTSLIVSCMGLSSTSFAAVTIDRTRAIFNGSQESLTIAVSNKNKKLPYLAQAWIENSEYEKVSSPFLVLPPVQRLEAEQTSQIRIKGTQLNQLPQDKESLFYFNVREVPPKSLKPNVMQIALQSKIKLIYRPKSIELNPTEMMNNPWQEKLVLIKQNGSVIAKNPTPYYTTILGVSKGVKGPVAEKFEAQSIEPFGQITLPISSEWMGNTPVFTYINDYGGRPKMQFQCQANECHTVKMSAKE
jgi:chaperone protein PapD